jgi:L-cysteine S-thiosulfotransferase
MRRSFRSIKAAACFTAAMALLAWGCAGVDSGPDAAAMGERFALEAYPGMPAALVQRARQDRAQQICSKTGDAKLTGPESAEVVQLARSNFRYPADGRFAGDWKAGEKLVYDGTGERIRGGAVEKVARNGALCSNCHALDPKEINVGNLGPALTGYGARGNSEAVAKYTYEKIYNAWSYYPCSNMPRFGHNGFLTPDQITHVVAYLLDPSSPVNAK